MISKDTASSIACVSCVLDLLLALILSWFDREGEQKVQVVCRSSPFCKQVKERGVSNQSSITKADHLCSTNSHVKWML